MLLLDVSIVTPSSMSVRHFNSDFIEPILKKVSAENKLCVLLGDFNINLLSRTMTLMISIVT